MNVVESSILTAILGDCMGVPYEFPKKLVSIDEPDSILTSYKKRIGGRYFPTILNCQKGYYSDDTQMLLMTLRSLQYVDFIGAMTSELKAFSAYECGAGRSTRASYNALEKDKLPWQNISDYYTFGGNGVAMRVLPHAFQNDNISTIMDYVFINGILTHGSPVALVSAQLYVYYVWCKIHNVHFEIDTSAKIWGSIHDNLVGKNQLITSWHKSLPSNVRDEWFSVVKI